MKKLIITTFLACIYSFTASAGVNVGISGQMGLFAATGNETHADATDSAAAGAYKKIRHRNWCRRLCICIP